ncbi:hypothetical protein BsWGS_24838 [Bradybaena similaris]
MGKSQIVLFVTVVLLGGVTPQRCSFGWVLFQGSCYGFGREPVSWPDAAAICQAFGGYLLEINNQAENDWIVSQVQTRKLGKIWLGSSDMFSEGVFQWTTSGETIENVANWHPGQPDNTIGVEHCLQMYGEPGNKWNDFWCLEKFRFVCEVEKAGRRWTYCK